MSRTTGRPAEILREGSGIRVDGTDGGGLTISTYIKDGGESPLAKDLPGLIYHQCSQSNDFRLRARPSFLTKRVLNQGFRPKRIREARLQPTTVCVLFSFIMWYGNCCSCRRDVAAIVLG